MSLFKGTYLRVLTPRTTDGRTPQTDAGGQILFKEECLPVSAKKDLDRLNKDLPDILKKRIELVEAVEVGAESVSPAAKEKVTVKK